MKLLVLMVALLVPFAATAQPSKRVLREAKVRFERANVLYKAGKYQEALLLYQAAYDLLPSPDFLYNLGLTREKLLDYEGCALAFERYVREGGDDIDGARSHADGCRERARIPVTLTSAPAGAAVHSGTGDAARFVGRTPVDLELAPGSYELSIELDGYLSQTQRVQIDIGARPRYDFVLEKLSTLRVEADVAGARVSIDGQPAQPAPLEREVPAGTYQVRISKPDHVAVEREVKIAPGSDAQLAVTLTPLPSRQKVIVRAGPGAAIAIDGLTVGRGVVEQELTPGPHLIDVNAAGHRALHDQIVLLPGQDREVRVELTRHRSRAQTITLWSMAGGAVLLGAGGTAYGLLALDAESDYASAARPAEVRDRGLEYRFRADLLLGTAVVTAGATVLYYLWTRPEPSSLEVLR